jgi:hypothetical protein
VFYLHRAESRGLHVDQDASGRGGVGDAHDAHMNGLSLCVLFCRQHASRLVAVSSAEGICACIGRHAAIAMEEPSLPGCHVPIYCSAGNAAPPPHWRAARSRPRANKVRATVNMVAGGALDECQ